MDTKDTELNTALDVNNNSEVEKQEVRKKQKEKKKRVVKTKKSSEKGIASLLVAIIAVGACLLVVSILGMMGVMSDIEKQPVANTTLVVPENNGNTPVDNNIVETTVADVQNQQTPVETNPQIVETTVAQNQNNPAPEITTVADGGTNNAENNQNSTPVAGPQTDAEWLEFFNKSVNKLKSDAPAMTKSKQTQTADIQLSNPLGNAYVSAAKDKYLSDETVETPIAKGDKAAAQANVSPDGASYVSNLTMSDIKSISHTTDASGNYVISIAMNDVSNPDKQSSYGKVFQFMLVDDVMNTYAPNMGATVDRNNVELKYSNCSAKATITPDGKVVAYETMVNANMILREAKVKVINTDLDATLYSITKYYNINW